MAHYRKALAIVGARHSAVPVYIADSARRAVTTMLEARADARVLYVAPGRVNAAHASFVPVHVEDGQEFYAIMWLAHTGARSQQATGDTPLGARPALPR